MADGGAFAVSMMEAAVRAAVVAGAPRRTVAATAAAVASAMATRQNGDSVCGAASTPSAISQRRTNKNKKKKERRKAAIEKAMHTTMDQEPSAEQSEQQSEPATETLALAAPSEIMALITSCDDLPNLTHLLESIEECDIKGSEIESLLQSFSALSYPEGSAVIDGLRTWRERASLPRYRHINALCNLFIAHEKNAEQPSEANALELQKMEATWHNRFDCWANAGRPI